MRINRRLLCLGLAVFVGLCGAGATVALAQGTNTPEFNVSPGSNEGAGFGETVPTPLQLRVRLNYSAGQGMFYGGVADATGSSSWQLESQGASSCVFVSNNNLEDARGCVMGMGMFGYSNPAKVSLANVRFPSGTGNCDPANPANCNPGSPTEGEVSVTPGGEVTVSLSVHHDGPGRVTAWSDNPDITVVNAGGISLAPDTDVNTRDGEPVTGSGPAAHAVPLTIRAAVGFSGQTTITARFIPDNGAQGRDAQDKLIVKKAPNSCTGVTLTVLGQPVTDGQTVYVRKGSGFVDVVAHPDPPGGTFTNGEPWWSGGANGFFTAPEVLWLPTDQPSASNTGETITADACGGSMSVKIVVVDLHIQSASPSYRVVQDPDDNRTTISATLLPSGLSMTWAKLVETPRFTAVTPSGSSATVKLIKGIDTDWDTWEFDRAVDIIVRLDANPNVFDMVSVDLIKFKRGDICKAGSSDVTVRLNGDTDPGNRTPISHFCDKRFFNTSQPFIANFSTSSLIEATGAKSDPVYRNAHWDIRYQSSNDAGTGKWKFEQDVDCEGTLQCRAIDINSQIASAPIELGAGVTAMVDASAVALLPKDKVAYFHTGPSLSLSLNIGLSGSGPSGVVSAPVVQFYMDVFAPEDVLFRGVYPIRDRNNSHAPTSQVQFDKLFQLASDAVVNQRLWGEWDLFAGSMATLHVQTTPQLIFTPDF